MKRVLVTGASKGIGQAVAVDLSREGYQVVVHFGRDEIGADETMRQIKELGGSSEKLQFDVGNRAQCQEVLGADMDMNGAYYGLVSNAGICRDSNFPSMEDKDWDDVINTNLNGFYNVVKPCVMPMIRRREPGRIVAMASVSALSGNRGQANYAASKAAIIGAVKSMAIELAKREITVNCVAPGLIETAMISPDIYEHAKKIIPMHRIGQPHEVASLVRFLLSESASYITRQVISVNGGMV